MQALYLCTGIMKIVVYGLNYFGELTGVGKYTGEMCEWFADQGHEVRVICAPPYYPEWKVAKGYNASKYLKEIINKVCVYRCPLFVPEKPVAVTRLLHLFSFALTSFPVLLYQWFWKPQIIITIEPTFFYIPGALILAWLSGAKSVLHIQDFELDAMLGLGIAKNGLIYTALGKVVERWFMRRFDAVSTISHNMIERAALKMGGKAGLIYFPNWADIDFITPPADRTVFCKLWNIPESSLIVLYSGNMGEKQGLEIILQAAYKFRSMENVQFIMVGAGAALDTLKRKAARLKLYNMQFFPLQPYNKLPNLMTFSDVHLLVQKNITDGCMFPSKLATIFSAGGTALITAQKDTELAQMCDKYPGIAQRVEPENVEAICDTLKEMLEGIDVNSRSYNNVARKYAEMYLNKGKILKNYFNNLKHILK